MRAAVSAFLRARAPSRADRDEAVAVNRLIVAAQEDRSIARADHLARLAGMSVRSLHRLLERHVGVGPKWIVRRARVQEAAERVALGTSVDWAALAQDLGYHDQSHFIRDFRAQVGVTPAAYARRCREAATRTSGPAAATATTTGPPIADGA
jgi:AraC-like DNA-binding protein